MLRIAVVAVVLGGAALDGDAVAGKRKSGKRGKVVRVERSRVGASGKIRACAFSGNNQATCYGREAKIGDVGFVLDASGMYGEVRVAAVTPRADNCSNITGWDVTLETKSGSIAQLGYGPTVVLDYEVTAKSRVIPVSGQVPVSTRNQETSYAAIDQDGDTDVDLYISAFTCDASGAFVGYGQGHHGYCMGYYVGDDQSWSLLRTDIVKSC